MKANRLSYLFHRVTHSGRQKRMMGCCLFLLCVHLPAFTADVADSLRTSRTSIVGRVTSAEKGEPVPFANVFLVNTLLGAVTDEQGNFAIKNVPLGTFELMASYVGYVSQKKTIRVDRAEEIRINLSLPPDQQKLAEVEVKSRTDKAWQKQYKRFEKQLLGETANAAQCTVENPWVVNFSPGEKANTFTATASAPLEIINRALGYKVLFYLQRFESEKALGLYVGETKFEELKPSGEKEQQRWERNRREAYEGSIRHFFKSLIRNTWREEGFLAYSVERDQPPTVRDMHSFLYNEVGRSLTEIQPSQMLFPGRMPFERKMRFPGKIEIIYTKENVTGSPYKDVPYPVSRIRMREPVIDLTVDGWAYNPTAFEITGHLVKEGVGDMLPFEYAPPQDTLAVNLAGNVPDALENIPARFAKAKDWRTGQKAYLHTDKPFYVSGETIWCSAFVVESALHTLSAGNQVLYVEMWSPTKQLVNRLTLPLYEGRAAGAIPLPDSLPAGSYRLRAYTNFMRNDDPAYLFQAVVPVFALNKKISPSGDVAEFSQPDVQFFPEGGPLVAGITSRVAFKAIRPDGKGLPVTGQVVDEEGNRIVSFQSNAAGMGKFNFKPAANQTYRAECRFGETTVTYALPAVQPEGMVMAVEEMNGGKIRLKLLASPAFGRDDFLVVAQTRGSLQHTIRGMFSNGVAFLDVPSFKLPNGICQLTLFSRQGTPVSERLVFVNNASQRLNVQVKAGETTYLPREKVTLSLTLTNQAGEPVRTSFSVAVTDAGQLVKEPAAGNLLTYLLLQSDLKGHIESPGSYFRDRTDSTREALDLLMLTQGWRRFSWTDILSGKRKPVNFPVEKGVVIRGRVVTRDRRARPVPQCKVTLLPVDSIRLPELYAYSDPQGYFRIKDVPVAAGTQVAFQLSSTRGKPVDAKVTLQADSADYPPLPQQLPDSAYPVPEQYLAKASQRMQIDSAYLFNGGRETVLGEVVVKGRRRPANSAAFNVNRLHTDADAVIVVDDKFPVFTNIYQMIAGRVSGVQVQGTNITIRGVGTLSSGTQPLFIIDGVPLSTTSNSFTDTLEVRPFNDPIGFINPRDVERIEVLKNPGNTGIYGVRGSNGVIAIYTRRGYSPPPAPVQATTETFAAPGYSPVREFYAPKYDVPVEEPIKPDKRATLFWHPYLVSDEQGKAEITFYLSDDSRSFQVVIEGVSPTGQPVSYQHVFSKPE